MINIENNVINMKKVYVLYEGDAWLSSDSLVIAGIFSSEYTLFQAAKKLIIKNVKINFDPDDYDEHYTKNDYIEDEFIFFKENYQTQGNKVNIMAEKYELDELYDI